MTKPWADGPYPLLESPKSKLKDGAPESPASAFTTEMAQAHNIFIRGLNAMTLQAPHIPAASAADVHDFALYARTWLKCLRIHHETEELVAFPLLEAETQTPGIMDRNLVQHEAFMPGVEAFSQYVEHLLASGEEEEEVVYDGKRFLALVEGFAGLLIEHLRGEIETLEALEGMKIDWKATNEKTTKHALKSLDMDFDVGFVMTHFDVTYEGGIHKSDFPPFPWIAATVFRWVYVPRQKGVWRFSPCDPYYMPKELPFA